MQKNLGSAPASVLDKNVVRVGAGLKNTPAAAPASVADTSKVRVGAGLKQR